jgi:hypothetical protein
MFRTLRPDEIDCRISQIKEAEGQPSGLTLLLYKDARCDQNILDETVTPMKWKREHTRDNRNCIVSIWSDDLKQWVSKEDTGTESNMEKEKGLASDSFKRACFNWGIGRELYSAPFIWIPVTKCYIYKNRLGKMACYDNFSVTGIDYLDGNICFLSIRNENTGKECYRWGEKGKQAERTVQPDNEPGDQKAPENGPQMAQNGVTVSTVDKVPPVTPEAEKKSVEPSPVTVYLLGATKELREARGISPSQNNKLFSEQFAVLIDEGLAPNKGLAEYTMEEAKALISAMWEKFGPEGTEIKK